MDTPIESTKNPIIKRFRGVSAGVDGDLMVAEGQRLAAEVLLAGLPIADLAWSPRLTERPGGPELLAQLEKRSDYVHPCTDRVLGRLSRLDTHQGISLILPKPRWTAQDLLGQGQPPLVVGATSVRDPGNIGAIVRAAEAAGATGMFPVDCADPYRDKAVRGSSGSILRLPCLAEQSEDKLLQFASRHELQVAVASAEHSQSHWELDWTQPTLLVVGAEGAGVPASIEAAATARIGIPIAAPVESLNVAVAAGVLLFEARRQREGAGR